MENIVHAFRRIYHFFSSVPLSDSIPFVFYSHTKDISPKRAISYEYHYEHYSYKKHYNYYTLAVGRWSWNLYITTL